MSYFNIVAETTENTLVTEYKPLNNRADSYQSETALENEFINILTQQGYEYLNIHTQEDLISNLCQKLEELNNLKFSNTEWEQFFANIIANKNESIVDKTKKSKKITYKT